MPIQRLTLIPAKVESAIKQASERTGASFDYLLSTARRESSLRPQAKSPTSSAAGLFQFVEGTWLKVVKEDGARLGLADFARDIHRTRSGKYYVPDRHRRQEILALRHDPRIAALVAAAYTEHNAHYVRRRIGREPSDGELYLAHFLGPGSAAQMIRLAESQPDSPASRYFPAAARANRAIFYDGDTPRSLAQVRDLLMASHVDGEHGSVRKSDGAGFAFGIMGGLIADTADHHHSHAAASGSLGIWGHHDNATPASSDKPLADGAPETTASLGQPVPSSAVVSDRDHRQAAQLYDRQSGRTQAQPSPSAPADKSWIAEAFGEN